MTLREDPHLQSKRDMYYAQARLTYAKRYKTFNTLSMETLFNLHQTYNRCAAKLSASLVDENMTFAGFNMLTILLMHGADGCPLNRLSGLLLVSQANITGILDGLVRRGFAVREDDPKDRRVIRAKISKRGEAWLDHFLPAHFRRANDLFSGLSPAEKKTLVKLLGKIRREGNFPEPADGACAKE